MCECLKELEKGCGDKLAEWLKSKHKATFKSAEYREVAFPLVREESGATRMMSTTYSTLRISINEKKKPVDCTIIHTFCPFCGVKYA